MFCNKHNVNLLTAYILAAGIEDAVVCPGSRNAVIVHNLNECPGLKLHSVTDERSAAFVAIGLWLATRKPIIVCVTSGSALLNLLPGVAEAYYRHIPLVIVSADRPAEWIGQLDGQTLPQPDALLPYAKCWDIADDAPTHKVEQHCREALCATAAYGGRPVHINVPLHEPLFEFRTQQLPTLSSPLFPLPSSLFPLPFFSPDVLAAIRSARHPAIIIGQYEEGTIAAIPVLQAMGWTIFAENISNQRIYCDTLPAEGIDLLIHIGGALVEKRLKLQLRTLPDVTIIRIDETDEAPATFGHVDYKVQAPPAIALQQIAESFGVATDNFSSCSRGLIAASGPEPLTLFVGNSTAVRWANQHLRLPVPTYCNRGVNGIEGSLSVAAGHSLRSSGTTLCLIGDLSFFYDSNALWNQRLTSNLRILLINNHRGGIFYRLPHLDESPALDDYIAAQHAFDAHGIAQSFHCTYLSAHSIDLALDIDTLLQRLFNEPSERPVILEVTIE